MSDIISSGNKVGNSSSDFDLSSFSSRLASVLLETWREVSPSEKRRKGGKGG
jgi:hypothetical protein